MKFSTPIIKPKKKSVSINDFVAKRNKIAILRETGGIGDILMLRNLFEDFKSLAPDINLTFACPYQYLDAVKDHPYVDEVVDFRKLNQEDYFMVYNVTNACDNYELSKAPFGDLNRSDIWAAKCGIELKHHNMHINFKKEEIEDILQIISVLNPEQHPIVVFSPISAMPSKDLNTEQMLFVANWLKNIGCKVLTTHLKTISCLSDQGFEVLNTLTVRQWMSLIYVADYVVSVDTGTFHCAGGLNKPVTGIFSWADGLIYGKWYNCEIIQKHRINGQWECGPCYQWITCPKSESPIKPCIQLTFDELEEGLIRMFSRWPHSKLPSFLYHRSKLSIFNYKK